MSLALQLEYDESDSIMRLMVHYFEPADLMHTYYQRFQKEWLKRGRLSRQKMRDMRNFIYLWLSLLHVVADGFGNAHIQRALGPLKRKNVHFKVMCDSVTKQLKERGKQLREFRNASFHYHESPIKHQEFLRSPGPLPAIHWANELHRDFQELFSEYRVDKFAVQLMDRGKAKDTT